MLASEVPRGTVKSVLDVWNTYHSLPIRAEDKDKLTFIMLCGRYRYLRAPQGYLASGDGSPLRMSRISRCWLITIWYRTVQLKITLHQSASSWTSAGNLLPSQEVQNEERTRMSSTSLKKPCRHGDRKERNQACQGVL